MANWANPTTTTNYDVFVSEAKERDVDSATMFLNAPVNPPTGAIKLVRSPIKLQEFNGSTFEDKILSVAGGGTGAATAPDARTALGIGTMGTQASNGVTITGGTISGLSALSINCPIVFQADNAFDIGTDAVRPRRVYVREGFVLPVGVDKFVTS